MPEILTIIYLVYMFIALYFMLLFILTFIQNRREIFLIPKSDKKYSVSVLIPAFNEQDTIKSTVENVLKSDYKYLKEIIIINDGSTDNSLKIMKRYKKKDKRIILLNNKKNLGIAKTRTKGLKKSKGKYIATFDADDISLPIRF